MVYLVCFIISLLLLLFIVAYGKIVDLSVVLLIVVTTISNGGFYALVRSTNMREAILANHLTYAMGCFGSVLLFFIICNICQIRIHKLISSVLYGIQICIFLTELTVGKSSIFYKTITFHSAEGSWSYLTKSYGPMHTVHLVTLLLYTLAGIIVGVYSLNKRTVVSRINVDILLFVDMMVVGVYVVERVIHLNMELLPIALTVAVIVILIPLMKLSTYSIFNNRNILEDELKKNGYIVFNKKLIFMGCNEPARILFPELNEWELEKKIPGNGGRFNTFLRQPLLNFIKEKNTGKCKGRTFEYKDQVYRYEIGTILWNNSLLLGYFIKVSDVTDVLGD